MKIYEIATDFFMRILYFIANFIKAFLGAIIIITCFNMLVIEVSPLLILGVHIGIMIVFLGLYGCVGVSVASIPQLYKYKQFITLSSMSMAIYIGTVVYFESLLDAPILLIYSVVFELLQNTGQNVDLIARIQALLDYCDYHYLRCTTIWIKGSSFFGYATHNCSPESIEKEVGFAPKITANSKSILLSFIIFGCVLDIVLLFMTRFVLHYLNQRKRENQETLRVQILQARMAQIKPKLSAKVPPALD